MFSQSSGYTRKYLEKHCRKFQFPQTTHMDAKFHPKYKDHIIVVGKNNVPERIRDKDIKFRQCFRDPVDSADSEAVMLK